MHAEGADNRPSRSGFDKLARTYKVLEYLSCGPLLWQVRTAWIQRMLFAHDALVLGDGDGRFTAQLLLRNARVHVTAVDASPAMLAATVRRANASGAESRLTTVCCDARAYTPQGSVDLICTHFFLDCLDDRDTHALVARCAASLRQGGCWIVSEFAVPPGRLRLPATVLVHGLYAAFRVLTGLRTAALPDYAAALRAAGLQLASVQTRLGGVLRAEVWAHPSRDASISL